MSLHDVDAEILTPMQHLFLPPRQMDEGAQKAALRAYGETLQEFNREDLKEAWRVVVASHMTRAWPVPGVLVKAAREARKDRNERAGATKGGRDKGPTQEELWARWVAIRKTPMAQRAAAEGYSWSLKCAVLNDHKKSEQIDARELLYAHNRAATLAKKIETGEFKFGRNPLWDGNVAKLALDMYRTIRIREAETAQEIAA